MINKEVSGNGEEIVILHGWTHDHQVMQPIVDLLSDRFRITNIDLPGCGQSDWDSQITNIYEIADILLPSLPKRAIYIAWSFGGLVSMSLAARHPERVKRFIGIATSPKFVEEDNWIGVPKPGFKANFVKVKQIGVRAFLEDYYAHEFADFNPKPDAYERLVRLLDSSRVDPNAHMKGVDICDATDLREEFQSIACPIDLILSEEDECVPTAAFKSFKQLNPNVHIHPMSHAHHIPFWTHPKQFNEILNHILSK